jgi:hypothetical protein
MRPAMTCLFRGPLSACSRPDDEKLPPLLDGAAAPLSLSPRVEPQQVEGPACSLQRSSSGGGRCADAVAPTNALTAAA